MAAVYSLVAWGGRTGKTVSLSATTDVVTLTNHGLRNGTKLGPSGTLPSELNTSTPVYARSTGVNTFTLHTSAAGAIANTGQILFAGSSTYAAVVLKSDLVANAVSALAAYGLSDLSRWGTSGNERIYDGLLSWRSGRSSASKFNVEIAEIGEAFTEAVQSTLVMDTPSAARSAITTINGIRTPAFHAGIVGAGYIYDCTYGNYTSIALSGYYSTIDGFTASTGSATGSGVSVSSVGSVVQNMIVRNTVAATGGTGVGVNAASASKVLNNLIIGFYVGVEYNQYVYANIIANNTVVKCPSRGFYTTYGNASSILGYIYNNISIGNGNNWNSIPTTQFDNASHNVGVTGDTPWVKSGGSTVAVDANWNSTTPLFMGYANNDFRPYASGGVLNANSTLLVDSGLAFYGISAIDIAAGERPNYNNGGAEETDIGAYEFDHGYGPHPASHVLTLNNVVVGSRVLIRDQADTTTHHNAIAASSTVVATITVYGDTRDDWRVKVRKASAAPYYQPYETLMTATPGSSSIYVSQIPDE
jgi:hypothetical protein